MDNYEDCIEYYNVLKGKEKKKTKYLRKFKIKEDDRLECVYFLQDRFDEINRAFNYKNDVYTWMLAVEMMDTSLGNIQIKNFHKNKTNFLCACITIAQKFNDVHQLTLQQVADNFNADIDQIKKYEINIIFDGLAFNARLPTMYEAYEIVIQMLGFKIADTDIDDDLVQGILEMMYYSYDYIFIPNTLKAIAMIIYAFEKKGKHFFFDPDQFYKITGYSKKKVRSCVRKIRRVYQDL